MQQVITFLLFVAMPTVAAILGHWMLDKLQVGKTADAPKKSAQATDRASKRTRAFVGDDMPIGVPNVEPSPGSFVPSLSEYSRREE